MDQLPKALIEAASNLRRAAESGGAQPWEVLDLKRAAEHLEEAAYLLRRIGGVPETSDQ